MRSWLLIENLKGKGNERKWSGDMIWVLTNKKIQYIFQKNKRWNRDIEIIDCKDNTFIDFCINGHNKRNDEWNNTPN